MASAGQKLRSRVRRHLSEAASGNDGGKRNHRVVSEMKQKACQHGAGPGAGQRKNNADGNQHGDQTQGPAQLRSVHESEQDTGDHHGGCDAKALGKKRIEIAAENGLFHQRREQNGHTHQEKGSSAIFEELLNGQVFGSVHTRTGNRDANRQYDATSEIEPWIGWRVRSGNQFSPAERSPERKLVHHRKGDIEKENDQSEQKHVGGDGNLRLGNDQLLKILLGQADVVRLRDKIYPRSNLGDHKADNSENQ